MIYLIFLVVLILLIFSVISILSFIAGERKTTDKKQQINVINSDLIEKIQSEYLKFLSELGRNNTKYIKSKCSSDLFKKINKEKKVIEKIICVISTSIISFDGFYLQVEFISRNINTEIIKDICKLKLNNNKIIFDQFLY